MLALIWFIVGESALPALTGGINKCPDTGETGERPVPMVSLNGLKARDKPDLHLLDRALKNQEAAAPGPQRLKHHFLIWIFT